jgi:chemotaxis protein methyltransferase CheR
MSTPVVVAGPTRAASGAASAAEQRAELSPREVADLAAWVERAAGLVFEEGRRAGLATLVGARIHALGAPDTQAYLAFLDRAEGAAERQLVFDRATIQETHFHRARPQIEALRDHVLPDVLARAAREGRPAQIWSAGCSTGEEPYTLAMLALEVAERLGLGAAPAPRILGTDVSAAALAVAEGAVYAGRTVELADPRAVARWLRPVPGSAAYAVVPAVRGLVEWRPHNLVADPLPLPGGSVDLVVCRNVTIYFARSTTRTLVGRFHEVLAERGWLLLGHAETLWQVSEEFALAPVGDAFAYRKEARRPAGLGAVPAPEITPAAAQPRPTRPPRLPRPGRHRGHPVEPAAASPLPPAPPPPAPLAAEPSTSRPEPQPPQAAPSATLAREALAEGRYAAAAELAAAAIDADPLDPDAYVVRGQALSTLGDDVAALQPLRKALYLAPAAGHAHFLLAAALNRLGDRPAAVKAFRAAAETLPRVPPAVLLPLLDGRPVAELVELCRQLGSEGLEVRAT